MDPGERITGTRDEHYDIISAAYHALQGAESCDTYALDAEAAGREDLAVFFRETQAVYAGVAERAKVLLGNALLTPEVPPEDVVLPEEEPVILEEDVILPDEDIPLEEDVLLEEEVVLPEEGALGETDRVSPEDLDATIMSLQGGVAGIPIDRALVEIDDWQIKLEESGDPELAPMAENLRRLSALLAAGNTGTSAVGMDVVGTDADSVGEVLKALGSQVQHVADRSLGHAGQAGAISEKLKRLGGLLASEGDKVSG